MTFSCHVKEYFNGTSSLLLSSPFNKDRRRRHRQFLRMEGRREIKATRDRSFIPVWQLSRKMESRGLWATNRRITRSRLSNLFERARALFGAENGFFLWRGSGNRVFAADIWPPLFSVFSNCRLRFMSDLQCALIATCERSGGFVSDRPLSLSLSLSFSQIPRVR